MTPQNDNRSENYKLIEALNLALATGDVGAVAAAIGALAQSQGSCAIAEMADISHTTMLRSFSETGSPRLSSVLKVLQVLDVRLTATPGASPGASPGAVEDP